MENTLELLHLFFRKIQHMKKLLLFCSVLFIGATLSAQTATDFTCNDCATPPTSHNLFTELDAGKVVVLVWVMPCGACIGPAQSAYATAQSFSSSHPGRVLFWLADDNITSTTCATLNSWATTNSMSNSTKFVNPAISMLDYGSNGMPKVVILGGTSHTVFYNANNTFSTSAMQTAITNALNATGITEPVNVSSITIFPNPANVSSKISYSIESASDVKIELFNLVGEKIKSVFLGNQNAGEHTTDVDCTKLSSGIYFVKIGTGKLEKTIMLSVAH